MENVLDDAPLIETDQRGRTNLGKLTKKGRFLGTKEADGTIVLRPATVMTKADEWLLRHPETLERIRRGNTASEDDVEI